MWDNWKGKWIALKKKWASCRWESKHLKGHSAPRVSDVFGSHPLGKLSVTYLDHTLLASCQWRIWITPSWQTVSDIFGSHPLGKLSVTYLDHTLLASCQWRFWITPSWQAVSDIFGSHHQGKLPAQCSVSKSTFLDTDVFTLCEWKRFVEIRIDGKLPWLSCTSIWSQITSLYLYLSSLSLVS